MRISSRKAAVIEWSIAVILLLLTINYSMFAYGSFTPLVAHEQSERSGHYGPSTIVKTIVIPGGRIYLCRYKNWFSADLIKKGIVKWYAAGGSWGKEIDFTEQLTYNWDYVRYRDKEGVSKIYGYVNDPNITMLSAIAADGSDPLKYDLDERRMFIFYWVGVDGTYKYKTLRGFDRSGKIIYEKQLFN